jgi:hypothetical protein
MTPALAGLRALAESLPPDTPVPGNGPRGRQLVCYLRDDVLAWGTARLLTPARRKAS